MAFTGAIYFAILVRFMTRLSRAVTSAGLQDDIGTAITDPLVDYMSTMNPWCLSSHLPTPRRGPPPATDVL